MKRFHWLAILTTALTFPLIGFGAIVRLKGAGLSCPDWPLCYGKVTPLTEVVAPAPAGLGIALEVGHRYVAGVVGLLVLAMVIWAVAAFRERKDVLGWSVVALVLLVPQIILGALTVTLKLAPWTVSMHLLFGNLFFASLIVLLTRVAAARRRAKVRTSLSSPFAKAAVATLVLTFAQLFLGGWTSASGAGFACIDFPQCLPGHWLPVEATDLAWIHMAHRGVGFLLAGALVATCVLAFRDKTLSGKVKGVTAALVGVVTAQILVGWYNVENLIPVPTSALHTALAATIVGLATYVSAKGVTMEDTASVGDGHPQPVARDDNSPARGLAAMRAYYKLTKPGILRLLLISTFCPMLVAAGGMPDWSLVLFTIVGMALVSGSANACNMVYDRDIDAVMERTKKRPLPQGQLEPRNALIFAVIIGLAGLALLTFAVNPLTALVALCGHLFYVFIYTMWLKRSTPQNIVIGGAAGAVPPLVGWAAVTGTLALPAWIMFAIIFLWTPPHFWALALYKRHDYADAEVPMLPVVRGVKSTKLQIVWYALLLLPVTVVLGFVHSEVGFIYPIAALGLGAAFCFFCVKTMFSKGDRWAKRTFAFSILYLALLFGAMSVDSVVENPFDSQVEAVELELQPVSAPPPQ